MGWRTAAVILVLVGAATYGNTLSHPFIFDDIYAVERNEQIRDLANLRAVFSPVPESPVAGRPLVNLSFAINYAIAGFDVRGYHAVNIALHLACALLLFGIVRRTLRSAGPAEAGPAEAGHYVGEGGSVRLQPDLADAIAFAIALLWMVHPLNSEVVSYVTERTESMMALGYLAALYASIRAIDPERRGLAARGESLSAFDGRCIPADGVAPPANTPGILGRRALSAGRLARLGATTDFHHGLLWTTAAIVASACGMACKESMVTLPVTVALYDRIFLCSSWREAIARRWPLYGGLAATWVPLAILVAARPRTWSSGFATAAVSPWTYLMNQAVMIPRYLRLVFWPDALVLNYGWARPLGLSDVWGGMLVVVCLIGLTALALRRHPRIGFLWAFVFITLSPASSVIPIGAEVGAERRMYLPSAAIVTFVVVVVALLVGRWHSRPARQRRTVLTGVAVAAGCLAVVTWQRNAEYRSALTMAETVLARWPTPVAHHMVGTELARIGRHDEALGHLRQAAAGYPPGQYALGLEAFNLGALEEAIEALERFVREEPGSPSVPAARVALGQAYERRGQWGPAAAHYQAVVTDNPADAFAYRRLADALFEQRRFAEALAPYRVFLDHGTGDPATWHRFATALAATGRAGEALAGLRRAVSGDPRSAVYRLDLARALAGAGDADGSATQATEAVRLAPGDAAAHAVFGRALLLQGKAVEARRAFERALQIDPGQAEAMEGLQAATRPAKR